MASYRSVLTLITNPEQQELTQALITKVRAAIEAAGAQVMQEDWLEAGVACDLHFKECYPEDAQRIALEVLAGQKVDALAQEVGTRRKRLLVSDMDSTMITVECIDELADFAGLKAKVSVITERAMNGELDFKQALTERVALLAGLPETVLQQAYSERVKMMPGARELVQTMRAHGAYCLLVSGGFTFFTSRVRDALGFHEDASNLLEVTGGKLTGRVIPPILDRDSKLQSLIDAAMKHSVPMQESLAVGDGANDLPMLMASGLGVAYHAKPVVQASARAAINHCDLSALLFAQGYRREEWAS